MPRAHALKLENSVVAITGGARGIGLAMAEALTALGAKVSLGDIDDGLAQREAARLGAHAARVDVRDRESFAAFLQAAEAALGPVDILINNAGIMPMGYFLDEEPGLSDAQIDINFRGVIHGMQLALPGMLARRRGHVINIASLAGRFAIPGSAVYTGTKFAVVGLTEAVAAEHRDTGVNFTVIMPSKVTTELASGTEEAGRGIPAVSPQQVAAAVVDSIRRPRLLVAVPDYLETAHSLYHLAPQWLRDTGRRLLGDNRILLKLDKAAHAAYDRRIGALAKKP